MRTRVQIVHMNTALVNSAYIFGNLVVSHFVSRVGLWF